MKKNMLKSFNKSLFLLSLIMLFVFLPSGMAYAVPKKPQPGMGNVQDSNTSCKSVPANLVTPDMLIEYRKSGSRKSASARYNTAENRSGS